MNGNVNPVVIWVGVLAVLGLFLWWAWRWNDKRSKAAAQLASELTYQFEIAGTAFEDKILQSGFDLFRHGRSKSIRNLMHGPYRDATMLIFEYRYVTGQGRHGRRQHVQTAALFSWGELRLPEFTLHPRGTLDMLVSQTLNPGIDFAECPEFSRRYHLAGYNEEAVRQALGGAAAGLSAYPAKSLVASSGFWLLVYRPNKLIRAGELPGFIEEARGLYDLLCGV